MSSIEIDICFYHRASHDESIEQRHTEFVKHMLDIEQPLGFKALVPPPVPDCGSELSADYAMKNPDIKGLSYQGSYVFRGTSYKYEDKARFDDLFKVAFTLPNAKIDYTGILMNEIPKLVTAFSAYRAIVAYDTYDVKFTGLSSNRDPVYKELLKTGLDMNGRDNIFTLRPAQFWDESLCRKAMGITPAEVVARLSGKVPKVELLANGVYLVLNTDPNLTVEEFFKMNHTFKPLLNLR